MPSLGIGLGTRLRSLVSGGGVVLDAPTLLEVTGFSASSVNLAWTAPAGTLDDYEISWRTLADATWNVVSRTPSTTATQSITGLAFNIPLQVRVRALNGAAQGTPTYLIAFTGASAAYGVTGFGDSITVGNYASDAAHRWLNLVAGYRGGITVNNKGISGTVLQNSNGSGGSPLTNNGRDRYLLDFLHVNNAGDLMVCAYGVNDERYTGAPSTFNLTNYIADYREVLNGVLSGDTYRAIPVSRIVLATPSWFPNAGFSEGSAGFTGSDRTAADAHAAAVAALADEYGVGYANTYAAIRDNGGVANFSTDNIHPEDAGHALMATAHRYLSYPKTTRLPVQSLLATSGLNLEMAWSAPLDGGAVTNYTVEYAVRADPPSFTGTTTASGTTHTFTGLSTGDYVARVRANFADSSTGPWSFSKRSVRVVDKSTYAAATTTGTHNLYGIAPATALQSTTPTSGTWSKLASTTSGQDLIITKHEVARLDDTGASTAYYSLNSASLGNGVFSEAAFKNRTLDTAFSVAVMCRGTNDAAFDGIVAIYNNTNFRILKFLNGTSTTLGTYTATVASNTGFVMRLEVKTDEQKLFLDGALVLTTTEPESGLSGVGNLMGVRIAQSSAASMTDTTGIHMVRCTVGTIT